MISRAKNTCPIPKGTLLIIGGHENKDGVATSKVEEANDNPLEILKEFITLTHHKKPVIEIITTASDDGKGSFNEYRKIFQSLGIADIGHIHHDKRSEVLQDNLEERMKAAHAFFFTGGDQLKLTSLYGGTQFLLQLKLHYIHRNIVLAGTSAGAMALSTPMIFAGNTEKQQIVGEVKIATGMEFLKDVCIDTHFVDRSRAVRMSQVIATNPSCIGIGIEEDTALVLRNGEELTVIGSGTVTIIEGFQIQDSNILCYDQNECISVNGLTERLMSKGDVYCIPVFNPPHR